jgi:hypothetical protein
MESHSWSLGRCRLLPGTPSQSRETCAYSVRAYHISPPQQLKGRVRPGCLIVEREGTAGNLDYDLEESESTLFHFENISVKSVSG